MSVFSTSVDHFNVIIIFPLSLLKMLFLRIAISFFVRIIDLYTEPKKWYTEKCLKKFFWNSNFPLRFFRVLVQRRGDFVTVVVFVKARGLKAQRRQKHTCAPRLGPSSLSRKKRLEKKGQFSQEQKVIIDVVCLTLLLQAMLGRNI